ncbi:hypothetical protein [Deinococcus misasensis]|uniref:hypothetical protein n=1 Tax=Deinococcus misasensis TaxID=392413 RepID=UPI00054E56DD|nr:hypothetical protein [Deinococcus misasensis]
MRFLIHVLLMLPVSVYLSYLLTRISGKIWLGLLGGVLGVGVVGALMGVLKFTGWLNLGENPWEAASQYTLVFGWNVGPVAGLIGVLWGLLERNKRKALKAVGVKD